MNTRNEAAFILLIVMGTAVCGADRQKNTDHPTPPVRSSTSPATAVPITPTVPAVAPVDSVTAQPLPTTKSSKPATGEQITWQVVSGGGNRISSTNYVVSGTVGQTAVGLVSSTNYTCNQGFWQNFITSCCVGKRGNVNMVGIVDLSDLSALVSYLTGGGYVLPCFDAANVNGAGIVDLSDLSALVSYLTGGGYVLPDCP